MTLKLDVLRISPRYTSLDWKALDQNNPDHWGQAVDMLRDRLEGRFVKFADKLLPDQFSGFVVLSIDSLLAETIQQFRAGEIDGRDKSKRYVMEFLAGPRFQPAFDAEARAHFYKDIRCGLLHQAEAKEMWLVRRKQSSILKKLDGESRGYILDIQRFHKAVRLSLDDYCVQLVQEDQHELREKLWRKMAQICRIRDARGLLYEAGAAAGEA